MQLAPTPFTATDNPRMADELLACVLAGAKAATCRSVREIVGEGADQ